MVFHFNPETAANAVLGIGYETEISFGYEYQYLNLVFPFIQNIYSHNAIASGVRSPESGVVANIIYSALRKFNVFIGTENGFSLIIIFSARFQSLTIPLIIG